MKDALKERETCYQCGKLTIGGLCEGCMMIPEECPCETDSL